MIEGVSPGRLFLLTAYWYNRVRLALAKRSLAGRAEFKHDCDIWTSCLRFTGQGKAVFGPGCVVERGPFPLVLDIALGGRAYFDDAVWFRGKYRPNVITCFENAGITVGPGSLLNGTIISARESVSIGRRSMLSWNTTVLDSNLHPLDNASPLVIKPVTIGDHVMIASGVTILAGATIGSHSVIGAGSVVTGHIPDHVVAAGIPARVFREIGDRDRAW